MSATAIPVPATVWSKTNPFPIGGVQDFLPVDVVSTTNINLAGVVPLVIDAFKFWRISNRVLLVGQSVPSQNGIYSAVSTGGAPTTGTLVANATTSVIRASGQLFLVIVTGDVQVASADGAIVTADNPGFIQSPGTVLIAAGPIGGSYSVYQDTGWERSTDANTDAEFAVGRRVVVTSGVTLENQGEWYVGNVAANAISVPSAISFVRPSTKQFDRGVFDNTSPGAITVPGVTFEG